MHSNGHDVIVVGGGLAGSSLGGVLARGGLDVLIIEQETVFKDRVRGESAWPWGVAEINRLQLHQPFIDVDAQTIATIVLYEDGAVRERDIWAEVTPHGEEQYTWIHPQLQQSMLDWAVAQGCTLIRPARALAFHPGSPARVTINAGNRNTDCSARLVVGASGKLSGVRLWAGGESQADPEHHRFGGALVNGVTFPEPMMGYEMSGETERVWFPVSKDQSRLYLRATSSWLQQHNATDFSAFRDIVAAAAQDGLLERAEQAGPLAFFPGSPTWATKIAGDGIVLLGDAAGSLDPTIGNGVSLLLRDVRVLGEALLSENDWAAAVTTYVSEREIYYQVLREYDRWMAYLEAESGTAADLRREQHLLFKESDPTLRGWAGMFAAGPDGLSTDDETRRLFCGELPA